jgi:sulfite reductase (NADPH) flavoprotein alpha-component
VCSLLQELTRSSRRPVPDVYEALIKAFVGTGKSVEQAAAHIEELKEQERYILEVY